MPTAPRLDDVSSPISPAYRHFSRRSLLRFSSLGTLAIGVLQACGSKSKAESATSATTVAAATSAASSGSAGTQTSATLPADQGPGQGPPPGGPNDQGPPGGPDSPVGTVAPLPTVGPKPSGPTFGDQVEMAISFTYVAESGGRRINNPYIATWIEDAAGTLIRTINVTFQSGPKGLRYIRDLKRWYSAQQVHLAAGAKDVLDTVSSPTRLPGSTSLVWDGRDEAGQLVPGGTYILNIEAAMEHGPYDVIRQELKVSTDPLDTPIADTGSLQQVKVSVHARA